MTEAEREFWEQHGIDPDTIGPPIPYDELTPEHKEAVNELLAWGRAKLEEVT